MNSSTYKHVLTIAFASGVREVNVLRFAFGFSALKLLPFS